MDELPVHDGRCNHLWRDELVPPAREPRKLETKFIRLDLISEVIDYSVPINSPVDKILLPVLHIEDSFSDGE